MAKVTATAFKAALATAAVDLTTAMQDVTLTELAVEFKSSLHALRDLNKLFILNKATGVYTSNDDYVDSSYAGNFPNQGMLVDGQGVRTAPTVVTATIETAQPTHIVLTFSTAIYSGSSISIAGAASVGKTIVDVTYAGVVVTIIVSAAYIAAGVVTVSGTFNGAGVHITLDDEAVTNNIV